MIIHMRRAESHLPELGAIPYQCLHDEVHEMNAECRMTETQYVL